MLSAISYQGSQRANWVFVMGTMNLQTAEESELGYNTGTSLIDVS